MERSASYSLKSRSKLGTQIVINPEGNHEKMTPGNSLNVPGPGTYTSQFKQVETSLSSAFSKEKRAGLNVKGAERLPAANAYNQDAKNKVLKHSPAFGFGTSKRPASCDSRRVPGPGAYTQKGVMGSDSQGCTLGKKLSQPRTSNMTAPGPGTYNFMLADKNLRTNLSAKIGTSTRDDELKAKQRVCNAPPPNTYNPSFSASKRSEPSFGFGTSVRQPLAAKKNVPGPQYSLPEKIVEGPAFHMGSKCEGQSYVATEQKKTISNPGPGSYAPQFYKTI